MELVVAMAAGIVVTGALFAILDVSLHQSARITDKVQADQLGRTAMTAMTDELHSACIAPEVTPVQAESSGTELRFVTAYGKEAVLEQRPGAPDRLGRRIGQNARKNGNPQGQAHTTARR